MAKNQTYKAFTARLNHVLDLNGELLDNMSIMSEFASEVRGISACATFIVRNDIKLEAGLAQAGAVQPAVAGRRAGVTIPDVLITDAAGKPLKDKAGRSRKEWLVRHSVVTSYRSWQERISAANGTSSKYVS